MEIPLSFATELLHSNRQLPAGKNKQNLLDFVLAVLDRKVLTTTIAVEGTRNKTKKGSKMCDARQVFK